ncbi:MAG: Uncharacterized protein G01um101470_930, partial [Parcubacteria group bacterium Gr01-1014_70]
LKRKPHIIIATPGRLIDHMEQKTVSLQSISILVLDEADRMFDMGFAPQITKIIHALPPPDKRQTMLFSATIPNEVMTIAAKHMALPVRIEVAPSGSTLEQVEQEIYMVKRESKMDLLESLLQKHTGSILVFTRTKYGAAKITKALLAKSEHATEIHSNKSLGQRTQALDGFKKGRYRVLVATDIAARGIDVTNIELVINFDIPEHSEDYVHRIGRTGRAGRSGKAITFAAPDQQAEIRSIEHLIRKSISVQHHESVSPELVRIHALMRKRPHASGRRNQFGTTRGFAAHRGSPHPHKHRMHRSRA